MDLVELLRAVFGLVFVLGLIALGAYVLRRSPLAAGFKLGARGASRLSITERIVLDPRRQVVILRDGAREHLVLLGATSEQLIETRDAPTDLALPGPGGLRLVEPGNPS